MTKRTNARRKDAPQPSDEADVLARPILIHCCKDRTLSYHARGEPIFNGRALPVFSVDTKKEAEDLIVLIGCVQYEPHPLMPGRPWRKVNVGFKRWLELEDLDEVTRICRKAYALMRRTGS